MNVSTSPISLARFGSHWATRTSHHLPFFGVSNSGFIEAHVMDPSSSPVSGREQPRECLE